MALEIISCPNGHPNASGQAFCGDCGVVLGATVATAGQIQASATRRAHAWPWLVLAAIAVTGLAVTLVLRTHSYDDREGSSEAVLPSGVRQSEQAPIPAVSPPSATSPIHVTYSVTGTKEPGDTVTVTYIDADGFRRTQPSVDLPWVLTTTPISPSAIGGIQASSLWQTSHLNCSITTSDGSVLSESNTNAAQISC